jgi:hypothetical protein
MAADSILKILWWTGLSAAILIIASTIVLEVTPLEFVEGSSSDGFEMIRFFGAVISVLLINIGSISQGNSVAMIIAKVMFGVFSAVGTAFLFGLILFAGGFCRWSDHSVLFVSTSDMNRSIVLRELGCGALDSSGPVYRTFEVKKLNRMFNIVHESDTTEMEPKEWRRAGPK